MELPKAGGFNIWKQSMVWYGYFLELPIRKGLLREVSWLLCLGGLSRKTFTFKPIKVGKTLVMMKAWKYILLIN